MRGAIILILVLAAGVLASCRSQPVSPSKRAVEPGLAPLPLQEQPVLAPAFADRYRLLRPVLQSVQDYLRRP